MTRPDCFIGSNPKGCKDDYNKMDEEDEDKDFLDFLKYKKSNPFINDF